MAMGAAVIQIGVVIITGSLLRMVVVVGAVEEGTTGVVARTIIVV